MKVNWNWGSKLVVGIVLYISFILTMVFLMVREDVPLVEQDYYPQAVKYQERIEKRTHAAQLEKQILARQVGEDVVLQFQTFFPKDDVTGTIMVYRPSEDGHDLLVPIKLDSLHTQSFPVSRFLSGKYIFKIDYQVHDTAYYQELSLNISR
ncbi:MAG: FixH family protein [Bacteroidales bacterium]|nr:FixH family protein [Bacteroidales bacterium]